MNDIQEVSAAVSQYGVAMNANHADFEFQKRASDNMRQVCKKFGISIIEAEEIDWKQCVSSHIERRSGTVLPV